MRLPLRVLIEVLRTRRGPTTRALDLIFTPPYSGLGLNEVQQPGALNTPLAPWGVTLMLNAGAGAAEVLHINAWPNNVKEQLRVEVLVPSVQNNRKVRFFWEPTAEPGSSYEVLGTAGEQDVDVTFRTPWSNIVQTSVEEVEVGVGTLGVGT
jgi:hypothetical protein